MKKLKQSGFGTPAVMAGMVLVAMLAALYFWGAPVYRDRQVQGQLDEVLASAVVCRVQVERAVKESTAPALSTALFGCDGGAASGLKISKHLKSIAIANAGAITVTIDYRTLPQLTPFTNTLTVVPLVDASNALSTADVKKNIAGWRCGSPQDGTTVPSKYLPANCRG